MNIRQLVALAGCHARGKENIGSHETYSRMSGFYRTSFTRSLTSFEAGAHRVDCSESATLAADSASWIDQCHRPWFICNLTHALYSRRTTALTMIWPNAACLVIYSNGAPPLPALHKQQIQDPETPHQLLNLRTRTCTSTPTAIKVKFIFFPQKQNSTYLYTGSREKYILSPPCDRGGAAPPRTKRSPKHPPPA
jgi:hypothetical protein